MNLTDEQRLKVEYNKGFYDGGKEKAKAIINWIEANNHDEGFKALFYISIPKENWQAFKDRCIGGK